MKLIKVRYVSNGEPKGRQYTFETPEDVSVGDYVSIDKDSIGIVTETNVSEDEIKGFRDRLKMILGKYEAVRQEGKADAQT